VFEFAVSHTDILFVQLMVQPEAMPTSRWNLSMFSHFLTQCIRYY